MERPILPTLRVADAIRTHQYEFMGRYGATLTDEARRALRSVLQCRTAALGGHVHECTTCGHVEVRYNSCGNRHCPTCGGRKRAWWLERESAHLLPIDYHHVVFTVPSEVAERARGNPATVYELLFRCASETLREVAANPKYLGAQFGSLLVLHTWGQNLHLHPHVHGIVTGGGLSCDASGRVTANPTWRSCRPGFFLPVRVLSRVYRGKFLAGLQVAYDRGDLRGFTDHAAFGSWLATLTRHEWVVYSKPPVAGADVVLKYLARYVGRSALSDGRIHAVTDNTVSFAIKDYRHGGRVRTLTLDGIEFVRRWVQHVLPRGFVAVRHYGLLANQQREERLALCRRLLGQAATERVADEATPNTEACANPFAARCPRCGGRMGIVCEIPPELPRALRLCNSS